MTANLWNRVARFRCSTKQQVKTHQYSLNVFPYISGYIACQGINVARMTYVVVSRLKDARLASEQHCTACPCADIEISLWNDSRSKSSLLSCRARHWGNKLVSMKSSDTSVPLRQKKKKFYAHSNLTSGVNEMSAYFHYQGKQCLHHHPLQLPVGITSLLFSTHINMISLIASHLNNPSFSVLAFPHLPTSWHYRVSCSDHLITWSVGSEVYRASLHSPFTLAFRHLASAYLGPHERFEFLCRLSLKPFRFHLGLKSLIRKAP